MIEFTLTTKHYIVFLILLLIFFFSSIEPLDYPAYCLHQIGTIIMLIVLMICLKKLGLNFLSFTLYIGFLIIHILGAHYLYSYVPYNEWLISSFNFDLNHSMGWSRNMYDRFVHISYGVLLYPFFYRLFQLWLPEVSAQKLFWLVIQFVMATSLIYEWIEWLIAIGLSPEEAENYNGQQGDIWDSHKDMFLATLGAMCIGSIMQYKQKKALK